MRQPSALRRPTTTSGWRVATDTAVSQRAHARVVCGVGALTLLVGFAVAQFTGNRALGGVVLVAGGAWCAWQWWRAAGPARTLGAVLIFGVAFVISHPLGNAIGAWPSVVVVSVAAAVIAYVLCAPSTSSMS